MEEEEEVVAPAADNCRRKRRCSATFCDSWLGILMTPNPRYQESFRRRIHSNQGCVNYVVIERLEKGLEGMLLQIKEVARIQNPRNYELRDVEHLRQLLIEGRPAQRDLRRENFYELEGQGGTYYIHISPISGEVVLLAKWQRQAEECCHSTGRLIA